jgi:Domain of unknown function (DUF4259)
MGTWDSGPFDNDAAIDFITDGVSAASCTASLLRCVDAPAGSFLDVDDGQPAIAVCELVALGFGYGNIDAAPANVRAIARSLGPNEALRKLALRALERVRDRACSEVAGLWEDEPAFDERLVDLANRLTEAGD